MQICLPHDLIDNSLRKFSLGMASAVAVYLGLAIK